MVPLLWPWITEVQMNHLSNMIFTPILQKLSRIAIHHAYTLSTIPTQTVSAIPVKLCSPLKTKKIRLGLQFRLLEKKGTFPEPISISRGFNLSTNQIRGSILPSSEDGSSRMSMPTSPTSSVFPLVKPKLMRLQRLPRRPLVGNLLQIEQRGHQVNFPALKRLMKSLFQNLSIHFPKPAYQ